MSLLLPGDLFRRRSKLAISIHEAAHAVVSLAQPPAPKINCVYVKHSHLRQWEGSTVYPHRCSLGAGAGSRTAIKCELLVTLAGPVAEARWCLRHRERAIAVAASNARVAIRMKHKADTDYERAVKYLSRLGAIDLEQAFVDAWLEAELIVHEHWQRILVIGRAVRNTDILSGEEVVALWQA